MKKLITKFKSQYLLAFLGLIGLIFYIWHRYIRERLPRDIPFQPTLLNLLFLITISLTYFYILLRIFKPKPPHPWILQLFHILQPVFKPWYALDAVIQENVYFHRFINNLGKMLKVIIKRKKKRTLIILTMSEESLLKGKSKDYLFGSDLEDIWIDHNLIRFNLTSLDDFNNLKLMLDPKSDVIEVILDFHGHPFCVTFDQTISNKSFVEALLSISDKPFRILAATCYGGVYHNFIHLFPKNSLIISLCSVEDVLCIDDLECRVKPTINSINDFSLLKVASIYTFFVKVTLSTCLVSYKTNDQKLVILKNKDLLSFSKGKEFNSIRPTIGNEKMHKALKDIILNDSSYLENKPYRQSLRLPDDISAKYYIRLNNEVPTFLPCWYVMDIEPYLKVKIKGVKIMLKKALKERNDLILKYNKDSRTGKTVFPKLEKLDYLINILLLKSKYKSDATYYYDYKTNLAKPIQTYRTILNTYFLESLFSPLNEYELKEKAFDKNVTEKKSQPKSKDQIKMDNENQVKQAKINEEKKLKASMSQQENTTLENHEDKTK